MPILPDDRHPEIVALVSQGITDEAIADRFACSRPVVIAFRQKHGIARVAHGRPPASSAPQPISRYYDPALKFWVKVYAPRQASGDMPLDDEDDF